MGGPPAANLEALGKPFTTMKRAEKKFKMQGVTIRMAREDELGLIKQLVVTQTATELDEREMQEKERIEKDAEGRLDVFYKKEGNEFYVAETDEGQMAGYVWWGVSQRPFSGLKVGWIYDIQVIPSFRGKGVGEALMKHALEVTKAKGFYQTGLMVNERNKVAWSLYEKLGFRTEHRIMARDEPGPVSASNS